MFSFGLVGGSQAFDPLILLVMAFGVEAGLGAFPSVLGLTGYPLAALGRRIGAIEGKLNRDKRSEMDRALRGAIFVLVVFAAAAGAGWGVAWIGQNHDFGWIVELALLTTMIDQGRRYVGVRRVSAAFADGNLETARQSLGDLVARDPGRMDDHGVARAAIESAAEGFCAGVVAPAFWYALFGFPGLAVCRVVAVMDGVLGHRTARYRAFGMAAARLNDILGLIPARLAGLFLALAAVFAPTARPSRAVRVMVREAGRHRSVNDGWPIAAIAGALDITLCGPRHYAGLTTGDAWIGTGTARASGRDISRALYLYAVACLINAGWVTALVVVRFDALP